MPTDLLFRQEAGADVSPIDLVFGLPFQTDVPVTGVFGTGSIGTTTAIGGATAQILGVIGTGVIGDAVAIGAALTIISGVAGFGRVGTIARWNPVNDSQLPGWNIVPDPQDNNWTPVVDTQSPNWS